MQERRNSMAKEAYCSFEISKLLKDKGFDEPCLSYFWTEDNGANIDYCDRPFTNKQLYSGQILRPTHQMVMAWLRKVHNIHIAIVPCEVGPGVMDYTYMLYKVDVENFIFKNLGIQGRANTDKMSASKTCEAALKYVLENLI